MNTVKLDPGPATLGFDFSQRGTISAPSAFLESKFGASALAELRSLGRESDPQLYYASLVSLASRLEQEDRSEAAAQLYAALAEQEDSPGLRDQARRRLAALEGRGPMAFQAERLLRNLVREAASPSALLAMGAGSLAFRLTRLAALSRLATSPSASLLTRGPGLRAAAALAGLGAETTAFTLVGKGAASLFGAETDWSLRRLGREWWSGALLLGALKGAGAATQFGLQRWALGHSAAERLARGLAPQLAMFGGILFGQELQIAAGLRGAGTSSARGVEALATLLQFQIGGRLAASLFGPGFRSLETGLDLRAEGLAPPGSVPRGPRPALVSGALPSTPAGDQRGLASLMTAPLMAKSHRESGGTAATYFRTVKQIESKLGRGKVLLELGTRAIELRREVFHHMYTLEDSFTSLLHGYHTNGAALLKGPLAALIRQEVSLRKFLLEYGTEPAKRLWAFIDVDTGELQRVAALDPDRRPRTILYWDPGAGSSLVRPPVSHALHFDFGQHRPEFPYVVSQVYRWEAAAKALGKEEQVPGPLYNGLDLREAYEPERQAELSAGEKLEMTLFPGTVHETRYESLKNSLYQWRMKDRRDRLLFAMRYIPEQSGYSFDFSEQAPPLPAGGATLPEANGGPRPQRSSAISMPPPAGAEGSPAPVPDVLIAKAKARPTAVPRRLKATPPPAGDPVAKSPGVVAALARPTPAREAPPSEISSPKDLDAALSRARAALAELSDPMAGTPQVLRQALGKLRFELKQLSGEAQEAFVAELEAQVGLFFRVGEGGISFLRRELPKLPPAARLRLLAALLEPLADPSPPRRALSFEIFRDLLPSLTFWELGELGQALERKFPAGSLNADRGTMVQQVRLRIRDLRGADTGRGRPPPLGGLAMLVGIGSLLDAREAAAAPLDAVMNSIAGSHPSPGLAVAMVAGATVLTLRSPLARRLGGELATLGSALLARLASWETPVLIERPRHHPYQLLLPDLDRLLRQGKTAVIARREGRELVFKTGEVRHRLAAFEEYPPGTVKVGFTVEEGDRRGGGILYFEPGAINLYNIQTIRMKEGAGTIVLDWLATQAARHGLAFNVRSIQNPQIFRILQKNELLDPKGLRVFGKYHASFPQEYEGAIDDPFFAVDHQSASFHVMGRPNPRLLPFYLRADKPRPVQIPKQEK